MGSVVCEWISLANCYLAVSGRALEARDIYRFRRRILADPTRRFTRQDRSHHNRTRHSIQLGYSEAVKSVDHYKHTAGGKHTIIVTCHLMGHLEETTVTVVAEPPIYAQLVTCRTNCGHILWIVGCRYVIVLTLRKSRRKRREPTVSNPIAALGSYNNYSMDQ